MKAIRQVRLASLAAACAILLATACGCGEPKAPPVATKVPPAPARLAAPTETADTLMPIVVGTDDGVPRPGVKTAPAVTPTRASGIEVDEKAGVVRISVRASLKGGVVEWLLSSGTKHAGMSMFVTECSPHEVAEALAKIGLSAGRRPQVAADGPVSPPSGEPVGIAFLPGADKPEVSADILFSSKAGGETVKTSSWVYVGPQVVREGETEVSVTDLAGGLITTNLRDSSALVYWVPVTAVFYNPKDAPKAATPSPYAPAFYGSKDAPKAGVTGILIIRRLTLLGL